MRKGGAPCQSTNTKRIGPITDENYAPGSWRVTMEEIRNLERAIADSETEALP